MQDPTPDTLTINNTRAINSLIFQLLATRQALHAMLACSPDPRAVAEQFRGLYLDTVAGLSDEPAQSYLLHAYSESANETFMALGEPVDPLADVTDL